MHLMMAHGFVALLPFLLLSGAMVSLGAETSPSPTPTPALETLTAEEGPALVEPKPAEPSLTAADEAPPAQPAETSLLGDEPAAPSSVEPPAASSAEPAEPVAEAAEKPSQAAPSDEEPLVPIPATPSDEPIEPEASSFNGITPGVAARDEVEEAWGAPREIRQIDGMLQEVYSVEPFDQVEVVYFKDKVSSIVIRFETPFPAAAVADQLDLSSIRPVLVSNELGEVLGQAYPERGVLFAFAPAEDKGKPSMKVSEIILEPLSCDTFVLRAETILESQYKLCLQDLDAALKIDPNHARAQWLRARVLMSMSRRDEALQAADQAVALEPENPRFRITQCQLLGQAGRYGEAIAGCNTVIAQTKDRPHLQARALCLLGDLAASGPKPDFKAAIGYHVQAARLADPLGVDPHPAIRVAAKEVLIDAHLGAAHDVAWGQWEEKEKAVTRWLERAQAFADELVEHDNGTAEHHFRVCTRALAACVGARGAVDPTPWAEKAVQLGQQLIDGTTDEARKARLHWDLGIALYDALQIHQVRGDHHTAIRYGEIAIEHLELGKAGQPTTASYLLGRLYFRFGAIYALRDKRHDLAVHWFDTALLYLAQPLPADSAGDLGRLGETYVSMGVSYWEAGQQAKAVQVTRDGLLFMEQAAKERLISRKALSVPYNNLATMHRKLGQESEAQEYIELATRATITTR